MKIERWKDDQDAEEILNSQGRRWTVARAPITKVDEEASKHNGARGSESFNQQHVAELAFCVRSKCAFKRLVCALRVDAQGKERLVILGGMHRYYAMKAEGVTEIEFYLVNEKDGTEFDTFQYLPRLLNSIPVEPLPLDIKIDHAIFTVENDPANHDLKTVCRDARISYDTVMARMKHKRVVELLREEKVSGLNQLPITLLAQIDSLGLTSVKKAMGKLVVAAHFTKEQVGKEVKKTKEFDSEAAKLEHIANRAKELLGDNGKLEKPIQIKARRRGNDRTRIKVQWVEAIRTANRLSKGKTTLAQLYITAANEKDAIIRDIRSLLKTLHVIAVSES